MKRIIPISILIIPALALSACGAIAGVSQGASSSGSAAVNTNPSGSSNSSNPGQGNGAPAGGLSALQLAAGMLKLDGTSNAVTAQQAAQLLPLWQSLQQIETTAVPQGGTPQAPSASASGTPGARPNGAMMQQMNAQYTLIRNAMTPAQIQAITAMNLSRQDIATVFQQDGIQMGGPGQGFGFRQNGGTFTPPNGTPRAPGTPGAFQGSGGFGQGGGRPGFGGFLPPSVVNGIVQYLQKKAGA